MKKEKLKEILKEIVNEIDLVSDYNYYREQRYNKLKDRIDNL